MHGSIHLIGEDTGTFKEFLDDSSKLISMLNVAEIYWITYCSIKE